MKSKISKQTHEPNHLTESVRVATLALTVTIIIIAAAYLLSTFKQMVFG
ncbi:MAG TPA: hypothetical protein VGC76_03405 [Pyrinomonadaceae bacterium]|jgi:hypothetical protein